jgi:hypothetical protein
MVVMDLSYYADVFGILRKDSLEVKRGVRVDFSDGTSDNDYQVIYERVVCSFYPENAVVSHTAEGLPVLNTTPMIFTDPDTDIRTGDHVTVYQQRPDGTVISKASGRVGNVLIFQTHLEAMVEV